MRKSTIGRAVAYAKIAHDSRKLRHGNDEVVQANAKKHIAERMGKLRGLPQKIGQILSMKDSADGEDDNFFADLRDNAEPLPFDEIEPVLAQTWGHPLDDVVSKIDPHGLAASLGQVHRATLIDGREAAIKVQYPGVRQAVMNDLKVLGWLSKPLGDLRRGFDLGAYRQEILRDLEQELDYCVEADHQRRYQQACCDMPAWIVPQVIDELSSEIVLVTQWCEGETIDSAVGWPEEPRSDLALTLLRGFLHMLFRHGLVHADPHPGNYRFSRTASGAEIVLYDFGSVAEISMEHRLALLKLIEITTQRTGDPYGLLVALGFDARLLSPIRGKLAALCSILFEPFCWQTKYDVAQWKRSQRVDDILGEDRWNFRMSAPAHLIFLMRAFAGLVYYLEKLDVPAFWSGALRPYLAEFRAQLDAIEVSAPPEQEGTFNALARHLKISVSQNGSQKVGLTFPASSVDELESLMDDELIQRVKTQGIDLDEIKHRVRRNAYSPQELFSLEESQANKHIRVWLE